MKILFDTLDEKEEFIEDTAQYDEEDECDVYICPCCHTRYEDFESCVSCCACSEEELDQYYLSDDDDENF